jgi:catechol 2,3-dioxygenase-like lactoylglutathione lyase family enzyme
MQIVFIASFSPIVRDPAAARALFAGTCGIPFETEIGDYRFTETLAGAKHFGLWPLAEAAEACFGKSIWPADVPVPQASLELEVADVPAVTAAARELEAAGHRLLHQPRTEPWGQTLCRFLTAEGLLIGVCHTPRMHTAAAQE